MINEVIIPGLLLGLSWFVESIGYLFRLIGSHQGKLSLGYTIHVQLATMTRFGSFVALPMLALGVDKEFPMNVLLFTPLIAFSVIVVGLVPVLLRRRLVFNYLSFIFNVVGRKQESLSNSSKHNLDIYSFDIKLVLASLGSYIITSNAFFVSVMYASVYPDFRASILQMTPALSFIGTLVAVFYLDTRISNSLDNKENETSAVYSVIAGRLFSALVCSVLYGLVILILE